eukprot:9485209-Pyramimonas_sp.AAC.1
MSSAYLKRLRLARISFHYAMSARDVLWASRYFQEKIGLLNVPLNSATTKGSPMVPPSPGWILSGGPSGVGKQMRDS